MNITISDRGFEYLQHKESDGKECRLASQSSAIGDYPDSPDRPGTSFLWIGKGHHLNREEVSELIGHLRAWLDTGSLRIP